MLPVQRALISVYDKHGLTELAQGLNRLGIEILSTGGTRRALEEAGVPVTPVSEATGFPEILSGRVKTLHPAIHGGILADRGKAAHLSELQEHGIRPIDMVIVNLYPFRETISRDDVSDQEAIEMIDIGGPTMVRAAAKNCASVGVVVDPADYPQVLAALESGDRTLPPALARALAAKAFRHTQSYDEAVASWMEGGAEHGEDSEQSCPPHLHLELERTLVPRYGENPHQSAALYRVRGGHGLLGGYEQLQGKDLSWNNLLDADAARKICALFSEPAAVIVKHNNPCGVGRGDDLLTAYERALACDPVSAFGSIIAVNGTVDEALAQSLASLFVEVLVANDFSPEARERLAKKKTLRLLITPPYQATGLELRGIDGGFLAQTPDAEADEPESWTCPTQRQATAAERGALELAWRVCRGVKSNAIVIANGQQTVGIGAGQMSRVDSCRLAIDKAQLLLAGTVAASDAFFPFRDGLDLLAQAGVKAVIQPGGSKRDGEVIAAADEQGVAMLFTGRRHFRH